MMEHNPVSDVVIEVTLPSQLYIKGKVDLFGEERDFEIEWTGMIGGEHLGLR
jgi:hypothetical protein